MTSLRDSQARSSRALTVAIALLAAGAGAAFPFICATTAWPEVVVPAYFIRHGLVMYRDILFPHTPMLPHVTALAGLLFGFNATVFRGIVALSIAATATLVVLGARGRRTPWTLGLAFLVGVPATVLWTVYTQGPALWPDNWMAPLLLGGALALERFERTGRVAPLVGAGLLFGTAILVKQTSAWVALAALLWVALASRHGRFGIVWKFAVATASPYVLFIGGFGALHRTSAHLRWTLLVPLQMGRGGDNVHLLDLAGLHELVPLALAVPACALARLSLTGATRLRSPASWLLLGCVGMTIPRAGLLHVASSVGLVALLLVRAVLVLSVYVKRHRRRSGSPRGLALFALGASCAATAGGVAVLGAGYLLTGMVGGPTYYWDDDLTRQSENLVASRVRPGEELLVFHARYETLYPLTRSRFPGGIYVNTSFWDCMNKESTDQRVTTALAARPGMSIYYSEPEPHETELRATSTYQFLKAHTDLVENFDDGTSWRKVRSSRSLDRLDVTTPRSQASAGTAPLARASADGVRDNLP